MDAWLPGYWLFILPKAPIFTGRWSGQVVAIGLLLFVLRFGAGFLLCPCARAVGLVFDRLLHASPVETTVKGQEARAGFAGPSNCS